MTRAIRLVLSLTFLAVSLFGCGGGGGGGGGDEFFGAAEVSLNANPTSFFIGDRTLVSASLTKVNSEGVVLVYRFPSSLAYVHDSAKLIVEDNEVNVAPLLDQAKDENVYLVFVFPHSSFDSDGKGELQIQLQGIEARQNAKIELDPSIRDSALEDDHQFDINNPVYGTDISVEVEVKAS